MKCKCCGAEIIRIETGASVTGRVVCLASPFTYWTIRDGHARMLYTPNGETVYGNLTGDPQKAVGIAYLPHTCYQLPLLFKGRDSWDRPVYEDPGGRLLVDTDPRADLPPRICTKYQNAFDGEPCDPVKGMDFDFIPCRDTWY